MNLSVHPRLLQCLECLLALLIISMAASGAGVPRILLVGDSWAEYPWRQQTFDEVLAARGLERYAVVGERTAIGGTSAEEWVRPADLAVIVDELKSHSTIDMVHLSVGGIDVLDLAPRPNEEIVADIEMIVDAILAVRSDIKVVLSGYDYIAILIPGYASAQEQNDAMAAFERARLDLCQGKDRLHYLLNLGLMHASFGHPSDFGPGDVPMPGMPPDYAPFPGGNPAFLSHEDSFADPIHLSPEGYTVLVNRAFDQFYGRWLDPSQPFDRGDTNNDGKVDLSDAITLLTYLFADGGLSCQDAADANDDGALDLADGITVLTYLFSKKGPLPGPFGECGEDPTADALGCESYPLCP